MSDDTYYTLLDVSETATQLEIKTAYRNLLKKIHPDTVSTLSPELRRTAEDLTKEINEAYSVLSDAGMRREYDRLITEYRQQSAPAAPPRRPKAAATSTPRPYASPPTRAPQPRVVGRPVRVVGRAVAWGAFVFLLIIWGAVATRLNQQASETDSTFLSEKVAAYCKMHPTGFYGAPGTASGVSCSDWAHLTNAEQQSLQAACSNKYYEGPAEYDRCFDRELRTTLHLP
jgi:hypothetical protein